MKNARWPAPGTENTLSAKKHMHGGTITSNFTNRGIPQGCWRRNSVHTGTCDVNTNCIKMFGSSVLSASDIILTLSFIASFTKDVCLKLQFFNKKDLIFQ